MIAGTSPALVGYVLKQLAIAFAIVCGSLTGAVAVIGALNHLRYIINNGMPFLDYMYVNVVSVPIQATAMVMPAALVATLFVYNRLLADRELVAMNSAGISNFGLAAPGFIFGLFMFVATLLQVFVLSPFGYGETRETLHSVTRTGLVVNFREKEFTSAADDLTVYIERRVSATEFDDVLVWDTREPEEPKAINARHGRLINDGELPLFVLFDGAQQTHDRDDDSVTIAFFEQYTINLNNYVEESDRDPGRNEWYLGRIAGEIVNAITERDRRGALRELHERMSYVLKSVAAIAVAIAFVLGGGYSRRSKTVRITAAVIVMLGAEAAISSMLNGIKQDPGIAWGIYVLPLILIALSVIAVSRQRMPRPGLLAHLGLTSGG